MLPIGDEEGAWKRSPVVTWVLAAIITAVYAFQAQLSPLEGAALVTAFGLVPSRLLQDPAAAWPTLLTHFFLHGSLAHVAGNAVFLIVFGRRVESEIGRLGFLGFYLFGGIAAGLASVVSRADSPVPGIGASGAISAVMGAYLVLFPAAQIRLLVLHPLTLLWIVMSQSLMTFDVPALVVILAWFALQVVEGLAALGSPGGVDYAAHIGGLLAGFATIQALRYAFGLWPDEHKERVVEIKIGEACVGAARPLKSGSRLAREDLQIQERRAEGLDEDAIPAVKLDAVVGRRLLTPRFRYEAIRWTDLDSEAS